MPTAHLERLAKVGFWCLIILSLFLLSLTVNKIKENKYIGGGLPASNTITVSGEGEVFAVPDVAEFSFSVVEQAATVEEAQEASAEKINDILAYLEEEGVDEKDVKTLYYNVYPKYEYQRAVSQPSSAVSGDVGGGADIAYYPEGRQVIVGYEVNQTVRVKVHDTEQAGILLSGVGGKGATNVSGLSFTIDDEEALQREARQKAIDDAQEKAHELADDLDVRLVRIIGFSESGNYPVYYRDAYGGAFDTAAVEEKAAAPQVPTGENSILSNITITYEIR